MEGRKKMEEFYRKLKVGMKLKYCNDECGYL